MESKNLGSLYTETFRKYWDLDLFSDYEGECLKFSDVAQSIHTLKTIFEKAGLQPGEKVAIYGRNSTNWAKVFLGTLAYGAVAVPVLPDFKADNVYHIVEHSEAKFLFAQKSLYNDIDHTKLKGIEGCIAIDDFSILECQKEELKALANEGKSLMVGEHVKKEDFFFAEKNPDELQILSYTSGSVGFSKGVMIPERSVYSNIVFAQENMPLRAKDRIVSLLPMAHVFGLAFEFLFPITMGCHTTFLTKTPSPKVLLKAFGEIKPHLIFFVPLILEKIYKKQLLPTLSKPIMKALLAIPGVNSILHKKIKDKLIDSFGGNFVEVIIGGAALSAEVETLLRKIKFPFTVGYGMTECGPLISYAPWNEIRKASAGKLVDRMEMRIESDDPHRIVGEIQVKGANVMLGYYKNDEANRNTFTADGWLKTGDLGVTDDDKFIYIKGRSKNMLLGSSGQNIYPEELEARLNNLPYIQECVVIQRNAKLTALVYPDFEAMKADGIDANSLESIMEQNRQSYNKQVASYEQLSKIEIVSEEFEKTPKRNIKRFLYT
ncbi:MAG: AMP-binding protein [Prolixibacteraceae bacterium]|nr:AMP-binding protein [Prolixibacteraceae bacterium]MBN2650692.1 AMP-binding protein [Prolixibacteraceae bacterium]